MSARISIAMFRVFIGKSDLHAAIGDNAHEIVATARGLSEMHPGVECRIVDWMGRTVSIYIDGKKVGKF